MFWLLAFLVELLSRKCYTCELLTGEFHIWSQHSAHQLTAELCFSSLVEIAVLKQWEAKIKEASYKLLCQTNGKFTLEFYNWHIWSLARHTNSLSLMVYIVVLCCKE